LPRSSDRLTSRRMLPQACHANAMIVVVRSDTNSALPRTKGRGQREFRWLGRLACGWGATFQTGIIASKWIVPVTRCRCVYAGQAEDTNLIAAAAAE
jgi:hypothetical protein